MDEGLMILIAVVGLTVLGVLLTAVLWRFLSFKARLALLGLTLIPLGVYLADLIPQVLGAYATLQAWWLALTYTTNQVIGLSLLGVAAFLLVVSRLIPYRARKPKKATGTPGSGSTGSTTTFTRPPSSTPAPTQVFPTERN